MTTSIAFSPLSKLEYQALSHSIRGKLFAHIALFFPYYFNVWVLEISMVEPGLMCYCISKWSGTLMEILFFSFLFQYWPLVIFIVCCVLCDSLLFVVLNIKFNISLCDAASRCQFLFADFEETKNTPALIWIHKMSKFLQEVDIEVFKKCPNKECVKISTNCD